jgi:hypothetical protein
VPPFTIDASPRVVDVRPPRSVAFARDDLSIAGLRSAVEGALPAEVAGKTKMKLLGLREVTVSWHLTRRTVALRAEASGLVLEASLLGSLTVEGEGVHCRAQDAGMTFALATQPALRGDADLALDHLVIKPVPRGTLVCGDVPIPLGPLLERATTPLAGALVKGVSQIRLPLGPVVRAGLDAPGKPRALTLGREGKGALGAREACLDLDPAALVIAPVGGAGELLTLKVGFDVAPRVTLGACPAAASVTRAARPMVEVRRLDDRFEIAVAVAVSHADLRARAAPALVGKRFGEGDRTVVIEDLDLGDASGYALARVRVSGALNGTLYLWGAPTVAKEGERWMLRVPDLHASLATRSLLERVGLALWKLQDGGLEPMLRAALALDITDRLAEARAALSGIHELTREPLLVTLTTTVTSLRPGEVASRPGLLLVNPILAGHAELSVTPASGRR